MLSLAGKSILITGASGALGTAVSSAFAAAGALLTTPSRAQADLTTAVGAGAAVQLTLATHSRLDAAIHLMGGFASAGPVHQTTGEIWDRMFSLNASSAFFLFRAALPHLPSPGGRLLAVGSRAALDCPAGLSAYAASKAALHALVRTTAAECVPLGITVNAVLPSTIDTPANRAAMPQADPSLWVSPASIAELLLFLASDAGRDTSGALIPIYGRS
jgi:NAD(P)-dependent dehydrogenase (short-subunit alcohol dehydrogenase family)